MTQPGLELGVEAFALVTEPCGRGDKLRRKVRGIARVLVLGELADGRQRVRVLSSRDAVVGRELDMLRCDLYRTHGADRERFLECIRSLWGRS